MTLDSVLLADRHHRLSEGVRGLLETTFAAVFMVADEASLMAGATQIQPTVTVVDLSLARGDIARLLRDLRRCAPGSKVVLLSVHDEPAVVSVALAAGADGVVLKRNISTDLLAAVDSVVAGKQYVSPAVTH